ncbi:MAG: DUF1043 family protein [Succinivibrio sp.]|nr:DUF1043 family protein [Succinivibrio sp.]
MFSPYTYIALAFVGGFILGGLFCWFGLLRIFPNHKMQDELTRTKRELHSARRALDEFFKDSDDLFSVLNKHYCNYADYMHKAASRLANSADSLFVLSNEEPQQVTDEDEQVSQSDASQQQYQEEHKSMEQQEFSSLEGTDASADEKNIDSPLEGELVKPQVYNNDLPDLAEPSTFELNDREHHVEIQSATEDITLEKEKQNNEVI